MDAKAVVSELKNELLKQAEAACAEAQANPMQVVTVHGVTVKFVSDGVWLVNQTRPLEPANASSAYNASALMMSYMMDKMRQYGTPDKALAAIRK
jgi:hypothetical protein